jgi:hypothetical protein
MVITLHITDKLAVREGDAPYAYKRVGVCTWNTEYAGKFAHS